MSATSVSAAPPPCRAATPACRPTPSWPPPPPRRPPPNRLLDDASPEQALAYLRALSLGDSDDALLEVFAREAGPTAEWLEGADAHRAAADPVPDRPAVAPRPASGVDRARRLGRRPGRGDRRAGCRAGGHRRALQRARGARRGPRL